MMCALRSSWCPITLAGAVLAACGGGDQRDRPIDAALPIDAPGMIDSPPPPPIDAPSRVSVTVLSENGDGLPDTTARVIFADPSNQLVQQGLVGTAGDASADLPGGGFVHVVHVQEFSPTTRFVRLHSIRVQPGDNLTFGDAASRPLGTSITVSGSFTLINNVPEYHFATPCGDNFATSSGGGVVTLEGVPSCMPSTFDVLGTADFRSTLPIPRFVWFKATPAGGFVAPAMANMQPFTAVINRVPVGSTVGVVRSTALPPYFGRAYSSADQATATSTTVTVLPFYPPPPADTTSIGVVEVQIRPTQGGDVVQVLQTRVVGSAASAVLDLEELPIPVVETAPRLAGKVVSWTQTGSGAPDLRQVRFSSTYATGGLNYTVSWTVIDGGSDSTVELPGLPAMFVDFDPTQQPAPAPGTGRVLYVNYSNVEGFDAARRLPLGSLGEQGLAFFGRGLFEGQLYSVRATMR